ncbi:hypothetical protein niasHT_027259 [Heterodera trifolii]|uniref:DNA-directed DNA polymerase n=1 Tax=Heterodera trifolii TaxID=157864 RepID=A0ABD2JTJ8_9BILA
MYCANDVAILRESVIRFRQLIADNTQGLDPFINASTAAGLALATLRRCFLAPNRLVHSPEGGYLRGRRASAESQRYIRFFELENPGAQVQCAHWSVGEAHIEDTGYRVDGLWRRHAPLRPLAIEWLGCYYHGCPKCFPDRQQRLAAGRTAEDLYERTERRLFELEHDHGCEIHKVWACQWSERLRHDPELKRRYEAVFVPCPLDPRNDALRGGRTEPFKLHHVCSDDEEILCIDIVSLYPYVMVCFSFKHRIFMMKKQKANRFPVGNPRVLTREVLLRPPTAPLPWTAPENNSFRGLLLGRWYAQPALFEWPLCLIVVSVEHRAAQQTTAGPLPVTNCVLRTGDGHRVEASGWQASAHVLASLAVGSAYWFINCTARPRFQRLGCWFRVGVGGPNALVVPHVAPQAVPTVSPHVPVQTGAGRNEVEVPINTANVPTNSNGGRVDEDINNNEMFGQNSGSGTRARAPQRRAAEPVIEDSFVIERTTAMRNVPRNTPFSSTITLKKQSLVRVVNPNDRLCLARAVLLGLRDRETRMAGGGGRAAFTTYASHQEQHGRDAEELLTRAGIPIDKGMYTLLDVARLQRMLNNTNGIGQIRLAVFEKEREYLIVYKAWRPNSICACCWSAAISTTLAALNNCSMCSATASTVSGERTCATTSLVVKWCAAFVCDLGPDIRAKHNSFQTAQVLPDVVVRASFIFPNDDCYDYHLIEQAPAPMDGRGQRHRQPICQWRRVCHDCGRIAYVGKHQCPRQQPADNGNCRRCNGPHTADEPCFIQPICDASARQRASVAVDNDDNSDDNGDDDGEDDVLPLRLCFFDAETSQDSPLQLNNRLVQKHVPLLIVAEVICERCLQAGISVNDGLGRRAPDCVCLCRMVRGQQLRHWSSPPFANARGDNTPVPVEAPTFNQRRFYFHSFDNEAADPVDQFLDFLTHHGPKKAHTVCIAHNGGKYDFHLILEALHRRKSATKALVHHRPQDLLHASVREPPTTGHIQRLHQLLLL